MRFDVLGPMRVDSGRGAGPVAGVRQRILLATLLAHVNQPVPAERLAEYVWDGAPPARAVPTLRTYVTRLRQDIGPDAAARIRTRDGCYLAEASPGELDTLDFEVLCRHTETAVRAADWARASDHAASALALWRGDPLSDVPCQALRDEWLPRLEQQRVQVTEWSVEAGLHLGRHESLVPRLRQLITAHPLRERFRAQLMLALYRSDRQAEALAAYHDARTMFIEELGIEPGPELRTLHERILASDPSLARENGLPGDRRPASAQPPSAGSVSVAAKAPPAPRQLPAATRYFTGRSRELKLITGLHERLEEPDGLGGTVVISAIDGMAGIGKTALAVHAAHRLASQYPDGQLFIDLHGYTEGHPPREPRDALSALLRSLGVTAGQIPADLEECAALYRQRLAGTRTLIVLDNARSETQVRPLLPGTPGCLVLITSRRRLRGIHDTHVVALDVLPEPDSLTLLDSVTTSAAATADDPGLAEIAALCGHLPLALRIAGALLRHRPAWTPGYLAGLLRDEQARLTTLADGDHDLDAVFALSYSGLDERQRLIFRRLALIPGPEFDKFAAAALLGAQPTDAGRLLEDLVDHNLLVEHAPGRYRLHDLIRAHARSLGAKDPQPDRDDALNRLLDYLEQAASRADGLISRYPRPGLPDPVATHGPALPDAGAGRAWLRAERANLLATLRHVAGQERHEHVVALSAGVATLLSEDGPWSEALALQASAVAAARAIGDRPGEAAALLQLGIARKSISDHLGAITEFEQAIHLYEALNDPLGLAAALAERGYTRVITGDSTAGECDLAHALRLYQDADSVLGQANALTYLGQSRRGRGDCPGAIGSLEKALRLFQRLGAQDGQAKVLRELGTARLGIGDQRCAARDLREALQLYRRLDSRLGTASTLISLGDLEVVTGDYPAAARALEQALRLHEEVGNPLGRAVVLSKLGSVRAAAGDFGDAARLLEEALAEARRISSRGNEVRILIRYAAVIRATGEHARARDLYQDALRLAQEISQADCEGFALEGIAECHLATDKTEAAIAHLSQALEIYERLGMKPDIERVRARLANGPGAC